MHLFQASYANLSFGALKWKKHAGKQRHTHKYGRLDGPSNSYRFTNFGCQLIRYDTTCKGHSAKKDMFVEYLDMEDIIWLLLIIII